MSLPGELDLHLIGEGRHERLWEQLGAHVLDDAAACASRYGRRARAACRSSATGTGGTPRPTASSRRAPRASGRASPERAREGEAYKLAIDGFDGVTRLKADPVAFRAEVPPSTASLVYRSRHIWSDDALARAARGDRPADGAALDLRGACRVVAAGSRLARPRGRARRARHPPRLHARRAAARHAAPVRPVVGLPGLRLLRPARAARRARRPARVRRPPARPRDRRAPRLGARPLRRDEWSLARFDGTSLYEHADPRRGAHPDWGTLVFNYGRHEVQELPPRERALLARGVPRRRSPRRRRRVDALPRLLARARRVGAQPLRRPRGPRGGAVPPGAERGRARDASGRRDDRRGVDRVAGRLAADGRRRARVHLQVEHGLDARHARRTSPASRSIGAGTTTS